MTVTSPCTGVCKLDAATGFCLGCARSGAEIADWGNIPAVARDAVWDELPDRFIKLGITTRRLPWTTAKIRDFVTDSLQGSKGTWVMGVVGAVAEFTSKPDHAVKVAHVGSEIIAITDGGSCRFLIDDDVRALTFDPAHKPAEQQRIVLAVKRERGRHSVANCVTDLGQDQLAITADDQYDRMFDLGLGRKEARFCVRCKAGGALGAMASVDGLYFTEAMPKIAPALIQASPVRVLESALGRLEVTTPIPMPGGKSPAGPHTHLLPDHLATKRALPAGMDLPRAYLPGAIFYPKS